jgi:SAM-dependent methyltransferase
MSSPDSGDYLVANIADWTEANAEYTDGAAERHWSRRQLSWGVFAIPESEIGCLGEVEGLDVVELGCGTAYISAWLARNGARPVGVDPTPAQLETARRMQAATGLEFPLVEAPAEDVPLPDASFDLALSEYGASLWADPAKWVPEAARLLRPGGRLVFLTNSTVSYLCFSDAGPVTTTLQRPQFGMGRTRWPGEQGVEFHLSHGAWIDLLHASGFDIESLHEPCPHADAENPVHYDYVTVDWARQWPAEEIWAARKR